jgi:predicted RNA-binding protein
MQRIVVEDVLLFYITKQAGGELAGNIVGVFQVTSGWSTNVEGIDDQIQTLYPLRIKLKSIKFGRVDFWGLAKSLSFVRHKGNPSFYLRGTPANMNRPIPERDLKLIMRKME